MNPQRKDALGLQVHFPSNHNVKVIVGLFIPQPLQTSIILGCDLCFYQTTIPSTSMLHVDGGRLFTYPIPTSIEEVMTALTLAVMGATPRTLLSQGPLPRQHLIQIAKSPSSHLQMR